MFTSKSKLEKKLSVDSIPEIITELKYQELLNLAARFKVATATAHVKVSALESHDWANLLHIVAMEWLKENQPNPGLLLENGSAEKPVFPSTVQRDA